AYIRSSTSTVSGKKSMPSRGADVVHVARTWVSPRVTTQDPPAWRASLPVSMEISAPPPTTLDRLMITFVPPRTMRPRLSHGARVFRVRGAADGGASCQWWASSRLAEDGRRGPQLITDPPGAVRS